MSVLLISTVLTLLPACFLVGGGTSDIQPAGTDAYQANWETEYENLFFAAHDVLDRIGTVTKKDRKNGLIQGNAHGSRITIRISPEGKRKHIEVSARTLTADVEPAPKDAKKILEAIRSEI